MAQRRMFSIQIINSARFLKMPSSSRLLYFDLCMRADDDGVVEGFNVLRMTGATEDDLRILVAKNFVNVLNDDLVTYIRDWKEHNKIRADRKVDSIYKDLLLKVLPDTELLESKERADRKKSGTSQGQTKDGIGKDSIGKDRLGKDSIDNNNIVSVSLSLFESLGFGSINNVIASDLLDMQKEYSEEWLKEAMEEAVKQGVRNLKYVRGILKTWKAKGFKCQKEKKESSYSKKEAGSGFNNFQGRQHTDEYNKLQELVLIGQASEEEKERYYKLREEQR